MKRNKYNIGETVKIIKEKLKGQITEIYWDEDLQTCCYILGEVSWFSFEEKDLKR
jgi:hypothetical protein